MTSINRSYTFLAYSIINQAVLDLDKEGWKKDAEVFFDSWWYNNLKTMVAIYVRIQRKYEQGVEGILETEK